MKLSGRRATSRGDGSPYASLTLVGASSARVHIDDVENVRIRRDGERLELVTLLLFVDTRANVFTESLGLMCDKPSAIVVEGLRQAGDACRGGLPGSGQADGELVAGCFAQCIIRSACLKGVGLVHLVSDLHCDDRLALQLRVQRSSWLNARGSAWDGGVDTDVRDA